MAGESGKHKFNSEHVKLEMPVRYPRTDAKEMTGRIRLESVSGVQIDIHLVFSVIRWH